MLNEILGTLHITKNCECKGKLFDYYGHVIRELFKELRKGDDVSTLNSYIIKLDDHLNRKTLCEKCRDKKIEKLTNKCGNREIADFLYKYDTNKWIPFNEFKNIEYLAKGGFSVVQTATWTS